MNNYLDKLALKLGILGYKVRRVDESTLISVDNNGAVLFGFNDAGIKQKTSIYNEIIPDTKSKLAIVVKNDKYGLINFKAEELIKPIYEKIDIVDGLMIAIKDKGLAGIMELNAEPLIPMIYSKISGIFKYDDKYIVIMLDKNGQSAWYKVQNNTVNRIFTNNGVRLNMCSKRYLACYSNRNRVSNVDCIFDIETEQFIEVQYFRVENSTGIKFIKANDSKLIRDMIQQRLY